MASSFLSGSFSASDERWEEKHRPIYLKDIVGNEAAVSRLKDIARDGNMPNLILSGPPGTGKTTSILALAHELLGPNYKKAVLELDALDERGIDAVINEITKFARKKVLLHLGGFKMIILDNVDRVTAGAQEALNQTMERYSNSARFAFTCYKSTDIIEPIQSRCDLLKFSRLSDMDLFTGLEVVSVKEKVRGDLQGLKVIVAIGCGDMRRALNILQATLSGFHVVNEENVFTTYEQLCSQHVKSGETEFLGEINLLTEGFMRGSSIWNDGAILQRLRWCLLSSEHKALANDQEGTINVFFQPLYEMMLALKVAHFRTKELQCDEVRVGKERDEANERATKLAIENEEVKQHILNEQIMTRKLKVRFLSETKKWKVRFLNEQKMTRRWKVRFADVKVERRKKAKNAKKQLKLLEKEKAELQGKVAELEMGQAAKENAELQRKLAEMEMVRVAKENAELQQKLAELEAVQAAKEKAELQLFPFAAMSRE